MTLEADLREFFLNVKFKPLTHPVKSLKDTKKIRQYQTSSSLEAALAISEKLFLSQRDLEIDYLVVRGINKAQESFNQTLVLFGEGKQYRVAGFLHDEGFYCSQNTKSKTESIKKTVNKIRGTGIQILRSPLLRPVQYQPNFMGDERNTIETQIDRYFAGDNTLQQVDFKKITLMSYFNLVNNEIVESRN